MASLLPQIRVTDPERRDSAPTLSPLGAASPSTPPGTAADTSNIEGARSASPVSSNNTRDSRSRTSGRASPASVRLQRATDAPSGAAQVANQLAVEANGAVDGGEDAAIDPLSQQIFKRTNTENEVRQKLRSSTEEHANRPSTPGDNSGDAKSARDVDKNNLGTPGKEKKKGVSFLSRFIGNKKKASADGHNEDESEAGEARPEGMEAQLFSEPIDNIGFSPRYPQPPGYIKIRSKFKKQREFDRVFLAQELRGKPSPVANDGRPKTSSGTSANASNANPRASGNDPIWATEFSKDGKYLAAGGQDKIVRVWAVISTAEERRAHEREEEEENGVAGVQALHLSAPVFQKKAYREYVGHESTILDLSWSKNNFLLSSSMDKTVRLWHISRAECLCTFKHTDFVPSIMFHPKDDRFFLAGSLDTKLRLWSIPDKTVAFVNHLPEMITAVSFTPDGKTAIAGTLSGLCLFYETEGLKYQTQIHVRSSHGKNAKGSKITGIQAMDFGGTNNPSDLKLLISSNDSRIRLYNARDKSLEIKFKGQENTFSQIRATFSDDGASVICGSEDRKAYIWSTAPGAEGDNAKARNQRPVEMFEAHASITTCAILAPQKTRQLLSQSEDPLYDLCNPPPVTLMSRTESINSSNRGTENGDAANRDSNTPTEPPTFKKAQGTPAYMARSAHPGGQIIVTADYTGQLKVFRQDCAHRNRLANTTQNWETASVFSSKKRAASTRSGFTGHGVGAAGHGGSNLARSGSTKTRASARSRRDSTATTATQPASDRILSWRQNIAAGSTHSINSGTSSTRTSRTKTTRTRSVSPGGAGDGSASARSSRGRVDTTPLPMTARVPLAPEEGRPQTSPGLVADSVGGGFFDGGGGGAAGAGAGGGGAGGSAGGGGSAKGLQPPARGRSYVSTLSSEASSGNGDERGCSRCGGMEFRSQFVGVGTAPRVVCAACGMVV